MTTLPIRTGVEELLRTLAPQVLGIMARRCGDFDASEDAVQEALIAAHLQWPQDGVPGNPRGWLLTVATRRLTDAQRSEIARRRREEAVMTQLPDDATTVPGPGDEQTGADDTLTLLFLCCHPALSPSSQVALTLRAVGGLTTAQIASAFLVSEATMAQRISRAKARIQAQGSQFQLPDPPDVPQRLTAVLHVLYLIFNEGYTASSGAELQHGDLTREAITLTRMVHRLIPDDGEVAGLLALMLLTDARRAARTDADGGLVPLDHQDRSRWDAAEIAEGTELVTVALRQAPLGPYQLQAAIAAVHDAATRPGDTDWREILDLYTLLGDLAPSPVVALNLAVATAMVHGPQAGLDRLAALGDDPVLANGHRLDAARAHLLELAGNHAAAREFYQSAARRTASLPERRYLEAQAAKISAH